LTISPSAAGWQDGCGLGPRPDFYTQEGKLRHSRFYLSGFILLILSICTLVFLAVLALSNHEALAQEILKDVVLVLGGGGAGYGVGRRRSASAQQGNPSNAGDGNSDTDE
jgi:hypothetical protein